MKINKFGTAINCMDGRTQLPVIEFLKNNFGVDYIDIITEPGPNKILAEHKDRSSIESIKRRVEVSIMRHGSKLVAVAGHHDCAGNPADKDAQMDQIRTACKIIEQWGFNILVVGLFVDKDWTVTRIE